MSWNQSFSMTCILKYTPISVRSKLNVEFKSYDGIILDYFGPKNGRFKIVNSVIRHLYGAYICIQVYDLF